jgi:hypothetical protein
MNSRNISNAKGVAMVEFAIVLPLLLMLLFGITELGRALYQQNSLYKAVESGARYLSRVHGVLLIEDDDGNKCVKQTSWGDSEKIAKNMIIYGRTAAGGPTLLPNLALDVISVDVAPKSLSSNTDTICVITVRASPLFSGLFGDIVIPFTSLDRFNIQAETEERYIGY